MFTPRKELILERVNKFSSLNLKKKILDKNQKAFSQSQQTSLFKSKGSLSK